ncbi:hypothetical protein EVAR_34542_1 [Eumeta japonica]|uniref:Uncharacterized protein n=1 Tax=Eumeta variegata TaxID=151549 RepID=A0A4C1X5V1_EUMVA|nr:hypothetical protein EVAR_34542_1 [Eumeta japonica]
MCAFMPIGLEPPSQLVYSPLKVKVYNFNAHIHCGTSANNASWTPDVGRGISLIYVGTGGRRAWSLKPVSAPGQRSEIRKRCSTLYRAVNARSARMEIEQKIVLHWQFLELARQLPVTYLHGYNA